MAYQKHDWEGVRRIARGLVVSCQASAGEPLCHPEHILALSLSAIAGGALALRLEGPENIALVRSHTSVPIVGLTKRSIPDSERLDRVYITAGFEDARAIDQAGADIIALDATDRVRGSGEKVAHLIERIHSELGKPVWADVATLAQGINAEACGADVISTTMYGYTRETELPPEAGPDFELLENLCQRLAKPVVLEGRVWHPHEVARAFGIGAYAVVVGSAITRPQLITRRFVQAIPR